MRLRKEFILRRDLVNLQAVDKILGDVKLQEQGFNAETLKNIAIKIGITRGNTPELGAILDESVFVNIKNFGENVLSSPNTIFENTNHIIGMLTNTGIQGANQKGANFVLKNIGSHPDDFVGFRNVFELFVDEVSPSSVASSGRIDLAIFESNTTGALRNMFEYKAGPTSITSANFTTEFIYRDLWSIGYFRGTYPVEVTHDILQWRITDMPVSGLKSNVKNWLTTLSENETLLEQTNMGHSFLFMFEEHFYQFYDGSPPIGFESVQDFIYAINNYDEWFDTWFDQIFKFYN